MNVYKVEILIVDHDNLGKDSIIQELENVRFPNDCIGLQVMGIDVRDIGQWRDDHPLNSRQTVLDTYNTLFSRQEEKIDTPKPGNPRYRAKQTQVWHSRAIDAYDSEIDAIELYEQILERGQDETSLSFIKRVADWSNELHSAAGKA